jgi:hypothetical protein
MSFRNSAWLSVVLLVATGVGCGGTGGLGQAEFSADCAPTDVQCVSLGFGAPIAVGGSLSLRVSSYFRGATVPSFELVSANPGVLEVAGTEVTGKAAGASAVLLLVAQPSDVPPGGGFEARNVLDFVHLHVDTPDRLGLRRLGADGAQADVLDSAVEMVVGDELRVFALPLKREAPLMGADDGSWTLEGPGMVLLRDGQRGRRRLVARAPGPAKVTVQAFGLTASLSAEVLP